MRPTPNLQGGPLLIDVLQTAAPLSSRMIVSWDSDGRPLSFFSDVVWDFSAYSPMSKPCRFIFNNWCVKKDALTAAELACIEEFKRWICLVMYARDGIPLSITTVKHFFDLIVMMCRFACKEGVSLAHVMSVDDVCEKFLHLHSPPQIRNLGSLISIFQQMQFGVLKFVVVGRSLLERIRHGQTEFRKEQPDNQHPPLPTKIYSKFIARLIEDLECNERILPCILELVSAGFHYRKLGRGHRSKKEFMLMLKSCNLYQHFLDRGLTFSLYGINRAILEIFVSCKLVIHTFSGMRDGEVEFLERDCLASVPKSDARHYMINGYTTKFVNGKKIPARWVVSEEAYRATRLAKSISERIHSLVYGVGPAPESPLFLSPGLFSNRFKTKEGEALGVPKLGLSKFKKLKDRLVSVIEASDIEELQNIDPFRVWSLEPDFKVGKSWRLTVHQLRRSLAIYATRSGLVTLPSLKRQLQHITEEMTRYYASGCFFAKNMLEPYPEHISELYFNSLPESQALAFLRNVLNSNEPLFGAAGAWYSKPDGVEITVMSLEETTKQVRNGLLSHTDTPVGGCSKVGDCEHRSFGVFNHCVSRCDKSILKLSKLELIISAQRNRVEKLQPDSLMWMNETAVLMDYISARDRILKKAGGV